MTPLGDWEPTIQKAEKFIAEHVMSVGSDGVVFGLSGGIDSAVTAYLCCRALGPQRCLALIMPNSEFTPSSETDDGVLVATRLAIPHMVIPIGQISSAAIKHDSPESDNTSNDSKDHTLDNGHVEIDTTRRRAVGNLNARIRMILLYYEAQKRNRLVVGTDDRSEHMIGYFTKHGDGACDILPIVELYKTQVWDIARHLGVPEHIIDKEPSPHLWADHSVSAELGMNYDTIDAILSEMSHTGTDERDTNMISEKLDIPADRVRRIIQLHRTSEHKRHMPPAADLMGLDDGNIHEIKNDRPWGSFERFTLNTKSTVKMISIRPGLSLSLQRHNHRSEYWKVISGDVLATLGDEKIRLREGDSLLVPAGMVHRLTGGTDAVAKVLEISIGDFSENDIVRLEDNWDRS